MKSLAVVFAVLIAASLADQVQDIWDRVHQQCQQSPNTHVPQEIFDQLKRGETPILPANFGLHANCMLKKMNLQDNDGHIISSGVKEAAQRHYQSAEKINQIVKDCSATKKTKEETALNLFTCLGQNRVNIGQL